MKKRFAFSTELMKDINQITAKKKGPRMKIYYEI